MASTRDPSSAMRPPSRRQSAVAPPIAEDTGDSCRICRGEATPEQQLFYPCKCSGSIKYVHQDCLMEWLSHSQKKHCELCKTPFRFTKLYDRSMPEHVPWLLFGKQAVIHSFKALSRWARYVTVTFIWLCWLPWTIRQIWRALFWIADGSWLTSQELESAVHEYASPLVNDSTLSISQALSNMTLASTGATGLGFFSTVFTIFSLLDPNTILRFLFRTLLEVAIWPVIRGEPIKLENGFWSGPVPRPSSLLSDFETITTATRFPIFNNAVLDVLEGQLVCLSIVTVFILVFLIREWVINQQPLLNPPEDEQAEEAVPVRPADDQRRAARRQRRALRQLANDNVQLENRPALPGLPPRRRATENNILVPRHLDFQDRPHRPVRAQSLVPGLQELENNIHLLNELVDPELAISDHSVQINARESPPLQRGVFDDVGQIRRSIEERGNDVDDPVVPSSAANLGSDQRDEHFAHDGPLGAISPSSASQHGPESVSIPPSLLPSQAEDVGSSADTHAAEQTTSIRAGLQPQAPVEDDSNLAIDGEAVLTPQSSPTSADEISIPSVVTDPLEDMGTDEDSSDSGELSSNEPTEEPAVEEDTLWTRLSQWLWQTDDLVPAPILIETTEIVANIDAAPPFNPARLNGHDQIIGADPAVAVPPPVIAQPLPGVQAPPAVPDANGVDDAEDLEGVLELLGLEGPIAGMIQNIIFSVFLITLTLSASIWCPYIWGKITLLFLAHPFSVFIKAPLFVLSRTADFIVDLGLFSIALLGMLLNNVAKLVKLATMPFIPRFSTLLKTELIDRLTSSLSHNSGTRLERSIARTLLGFRPDLPTFSVQSHHILRVVRATGTRLITKAGSSLYTTAVDSPSSFSWRSLRNLPTSLTVTLRHLPSTILTGMTDFRQWAMQLQKDLRPISFSKPEEIDLSLVQWSASEKIFCILLGYMLFALVGYLYMKISRRMLGLKRNEKVGGVLADSLRQAGGVMKVVIIIGIEMILFPLYCGTMLDLALLPLFESATLLTRFRFFAHAPLTALFIHWFIGTCYMFHFALFVSMCRKVMRKGVLYFIRDPDDPSFHPVRDVLERPVATQLGKILFSAFVYGSLLVICLGGVVSGLDKAGGILPLQWGMRDTLIVIPGDIIFYNFMLPLLIRKIDVSTRVKTVFGWWFRACAAGLRLSDFLFGLDNDDEKKAGVFLWSRFFHVALNGDERSVHPMVKYIEDLASHRERLLWFEALEGNVDRDLVLSLVGPSRDFKIVNLVDNKTQALVEFGPEEDMPLIRKLLDDESKKPNSKYQIQQISDMKVEDIQINPSRKTLVDHTAGSYVRAPAKDSVRVPKGTPVFIPVNEEDVRLDGKDDADVGLHAKKDDRFSRIYIPNNFRARISAFIALIWFFVAVAGTLFTVGPLLTGRAVIRYLADSGTYNDLYAITIGVHIFGVIGFSIYLVNSQVVGHTTKFRNLFRSGRQAFPLIAAVLKQILGLLYLCASIGFVIPMALSVLAEMFVNIPAYTYLLANDAKSEQSSANPLISTTQGTNTQPIIHVLQTWAMGLLYLRVVLRILMTTPHENTRPAMAIRSITRSGFLKPDVKLATRALILPVLAVCILLLGLPPLFARAFIASYSQDPGTESVTRIYCYSYPVLLSVVCAGYALRRLQARVSKWRVKIRDEVYLIGQKLHNFPGQDTTTSKRKQKARELKSNVIVKEVGVHLTSSANAIDEQENFFSSPDAEQMEIIDQQPDFRFKDNIGPDEDLDTNNEKDTTKREFNENIKEFEHMTELRGLPSADDVGEFGVNVFGAGE